MTYAGSSSRNSTRVLITLVVITIVLVAWWAMSGGLDQVPVSGADTAVLSDN